MISATYVGGPTVILELGSFRIITDPTLDPAGTTFMVNDKPGYSKTQDPATPDIGKIDLVLLSHDQHGDNLDHAGRELLAKVPLTLTTPIGAQRLKGNAKALNTWESTTIKTNEGEEIVITSTPARHGPAGIEKLAGDVTGAFPQAAIIPVHFEGWSHFTQPLEAIEKSFAALGLSQRLLILPPGKRTSL